MLRLGRRNRLRDSDRPAWVAVGLGNPGKEYSASRHNAGFRTVDILADKFGAAFKGSKARAVVAEASADGVKMLLAKPTTYMNESGQAVGALMRYFKVEPENLIVVHDDADLKQAQLRLKFGGGSGGHHGIESIERAIRSRDFYRVRIGAGRPIPGERVPPDFLLDRLSKKEAEGMAFAEANAADAVLAIVHDGIDRAMNQFNSSAPS